MKSNNYKMKIGVENQQLNDVVILRAFAIITVVVYHSYGIYCKGECVLDITTEYGGLYKQFLLNFFAFRMPLFVFVSGYLFAHLYWNKGKYKKMFPFIKNKSKRLLLPYSIFSILLGITLWGTQKFTLITFLSGHNHLWFLLMLFFCFVAGRVWIFLYEKFPNKYFLVVSFIISVLISYHPIKRFLWIFGIVYAEGFFFWFLLGMLVLMYRNDVLKLLNKKITIAALFVCYLVSCFFVGNWTLVHPISIPFFAWLSRFSAIFLAYYVANTLLDRKIISVSPFLESFNKCSYGIYIFHYWIILLVYLHKNTMQVKLVYLAITYPVIYPIIASLSCLLISYFFAKNVLKTKVGRFLIG
jgi:peptidoglycan/LPS O-acetylase OafA/YrhL